MQQPIIVTGGAGFIGSNLVRLLLRYDENVITLDALTYAGNRDNLNNLENASRHEFVEGSINNQQLVSDLLDKYQPKALINLAAESHVDCSIASAAHFIKTNLEGTYCLLEATRKHVETTLKGKPNDFRFIHVSTDEVFGSIKDGRAPESSPYQPNSPYAASKAGADHLVHAWHQTYGLPTIITNSCNNYGPFQFPEKLIPLMAIKALMDEPLPIYGDGKHERQWIYVEDHCLALKRVIDEGKIGEKYNLGNDSPIDNFTVVQTICRTLDALKPRGDKQAHETAIEFVDDRPGHDRRYALDGAKVARELNWKPTTNFQDGLKETIVWYLENSTWWQEILKERYSGERLGLL
jgi:dTDP-glucose 4,6-dehydratase